ncbi:MAG: SpoIIE family protein phosphatase [Bdellovibrionales bacterium]|nr:SpoIIE family protein phosphatase [Bdellovibrionales bacterium]
METPETQVTEPQTPSEIPPQDSSPTEETKVETQATGATEARNTEIPVTSDGKRRISLKYKLLALLVTLPLVSLGLYLILATRLFESDKLAYVFDSTAMAVRSIASRSRIEIDNHMKFLNSYLDDFDDQSRSFLSVTKARFAKEPTHILMQVYRVKEGRQPELLGAMTKANNNQEIVGLQDALNQIYKEESRVGEWAKEATSSSGFALRLAKGPIRDLVAMIKLHSKDGSKTITHAAVLWLRLDSLARSIAQANTYTGFLLQPNGQVIFGPDPSNEKAEKVAEFGSWKFFQDLQSKKVSDGTVEATASDGKQLLASYSRVGLGDILAVGLVRKKEALKAVEILLWKSIIFFIALISFAVMTSVVASGTLTRTLRQLYTATEKVSSGDFNVQVNVNSNDEVGSLAQSFNKMAAEVARLIQATANQARMEAELATAKAVQDSLFPEPRFEEGGVAVAGVYQPASECGGDWWFHCKIGKKVFLWIGDATGHGAPAALLTSAARSAASIIEKLPDMRPALAMKFLNNAIHHSSKGKMNMTFFIASLDIETGEFIYTNASHDPPYLLRETSKKLSKKDLEPLNEVNSPRLGEEADYDYQEVTLTLNPGDAIFFYTDGVPDVTNPEGVAWGSKQFIKSILGSVSNGTKASDAVDQVLGQVNDYRKNTEQPDDVTFFLCKYH